jgi:hypothetical protein
MTATELGLQIVNGILADTKQPKGVRSTPKAIRCKETECNKYALKPSGLCKPHFFALRATS